MKEETEGAFARTPLNRAAGSAVRRARQHRALTQSVMAERLGDAVGADMTEGQVGHYERSTRTVPAAVLLAAAMVAELPVWALLAEMDDQPRYNAWLAAIFDVEGLRTEMDVLKAQVAHIYHRAGIPLEEAPMNSTAHSPHGPQAAEGQP